MKTQQFLKSLIVPVIAGAALAYIWYNFGRLPAVLIVSVPLLVLMFWRKPEYGLYLFFALVIILTDSMSRDVEGIFAIKDVDVGKNLPPLLICFLLLMCFIYFFKLYFVERKESLIKLRYGFFIIIILILATGTGIWQGWDPHNIRDDFYNVLFPLLCFYLCANLLNTRQKVYTMLGIIFIVGVVDAFILDVFYLTGHGWPYGSQDFVLERIVTQDTVDLIVFSTMTITVCSASISGILTGWRRVFALAGCLPMLFAFFFSFRRGHWIGMIATLILFYMLSTKLVKRKILSFVGVATVVILTVALIVAILLSKTVTETDTLYPFAKRAISIINPQQSSNVHHLLESQQTLKDILSSPILGLGLGSIHSPVYGIDWQAEKQPLRIVHNTFLLIWMKLGLPGLFFFIWVAHNYISGLLKYHKSKVSSYSDPIIKAIGSTLGLWLVLLMTGPVMAYWHQTFILALFAAIVLSLIRQHQVEEIDESSISWREDHSLAEVGNRR